jgi:hypothetical protein
MRWLEKIASDRRLANSELRASLPAVPAFDQNDECKCEDCLSAVSRLAYLADLLDFTTTAVRRFVEGSVGFRLILSGCRENSASNSVNCFSLAPRSSVKSIRFASASRSCDVAWSQYLRQVLPHTYRLLLQRQGTSVDEIRLATHADAKERQQLADRLGIEALECGKYLLSADTRTLMGSPI